MARRPEKNIHKMVCIVDFRLSGVMANHVTRINTQLDKGGKPVIKDLKTDLCDGVRLLYLLVPP